MAIQQEPIFANGFPGHVTRISKPSLFGMDLIFDALDVAAAETLHLAAQLPILPVWMIDLSNMEMMPECLEVLCCARRFHG